MKRTFAFLLALCMLMSLAACGGETASSAAAQAESAASAEVGTAQAEGAASAEEAAREETAPAEAAASAEGAASAVESAEEELPAYEPTEEELAARAEIEAALNLSNMDQSWTYSAGSDAWVMTVVTDVVNPELPDYQGVSVAAPGAYITGIDTDGDGQADVTSADAGEETVTGALVIDHEAEIVSTNGQTYTADTCPVIFTTGAAGYGSQWNSTASTTYCPEGYVAVACGNRGKQSYVADADGNVDYYTGDAPSCLCDQKAATRFVKYNMLLGNLPGSVDYWVTTGGSGGAAHAAMYAATSNNPDFYDYQIEAGAVGVYRNSDGSYSTEVTVDGEAVSISDGVWGTIAYSAITSLYEGDMAQAFEYNLDTTYSFGTDFQDQLAEYLSTEYMEYINAKELEVDERKVALDVNDDGDTDDVIALTIDYDQEKYADTNGYGGTYLDLYLKIFRSNLQWYLDNLSYAEGWTWFDENGAALSDEDVAAMTREDMALAFIEGRYDKGSTGFGGPGGPGGPPGGGMMGPPPDMMPSAAASDDGGDTAAEEFGSEIRSGGPEEGTTASAASGENSTSYGTYDELVAAYESDIAEIQAGDAYGKNIVDLYNPLNYIGAEGTADPVWTRVVMGAVEGDMPMMASMNMMLQWLDSGVDAVIEWQWDGGHVPNEIFGQSLNLYVDQMYGEHVSGVESIKPEAEAQTANGTAESASGKDLSGWVDTSDLSSISFSLADVMAYRNAGAMKAVPGFDVIDYGQEDYVFGDRDSDARHWDPNVLAILQNEEYAAVLADLF